MLATGDLGFGAAGSCIPRRCHFETAAGTPAVDADLVLTVEAAGGGVNFSKDSKAALDLQALLLLRNKHQVFTKGWSTGHCPAVALVTTTESAGAEGNDK